jgi:hypothetical protein
VAAGWGEAAEAPRCATVLVLRRGGTAPMAGGSGNEQRTHPAPQPGQQAERRELREGGRAACGGGAGGGGGTQLRGESGGVGSSGSGVWRRVRAGGCARH